MAVVNADQTVIILWNEKAGVQDFVRKAAFKGEGVDFGFIIPSPSKPELQESGDKAFRFLKKLTAPDEEWRMGRGFFGCTTTKSEQGGKNSADQSAVRVLDEKDVAGFRATVIEADSATALAQWLKENDYAHSDAVKDWARPYIEKKWKFTALKIHKGTQDSVDATAPALRLSFETDRPLFPYREPASTSSAASLGAKKRLLRIYFLADARYKAGFNVPWADWTGNAVWAGRLQDSHREKLIKRMGLAIDSAPTTLYLTEFEDEWPYADAPSDLFFSREADQSDLRRAPIITYGPSPMDLTAYALGAILLFLIVWRFRNAAATRR